MAVVESVAPVKPLLRGWMHLVWFEACLVLGTLALVHTHGAVRITGLAIFVVSVSAMFGVSAFYHRGNWSETWRVRLQRVDHAMIFLLIAGTATPAFLIASHGVFRIACLAALWTLTLVAGAIHMVWMNAPELLVGSTFVALGWAGGLAIPAVWVHSGAAAGVLLLVGRPAVHGRGAVVPVPLAQPQPGRVRLPRGLPRLRLRRRDLPVHRDRGVHRLTCPGAYSTA